MKLNQLAHDESTEETTSLQRLDERTYKRLQATHVLETTEPSRAIPPNNPQAWARQGCQTQKGAFQISEVDLKKLFL